MSLSGSRLRRTPDLRSLPDTKHLWARLQGRRLGVTLSDEAHPVRVAGFVVVSRAHREHIRRKVRRAELETWVQVAALIVAAQVLRANVGPLDLDCRQHGDWIGRIVTFEVDSDSDVRRQRTEIVDIRHRPRTEEAVGIVVVDAERTVPEASRTANGSGGAGRSGCAARFRLHLPVGLRCMEARDANGDGRNNTSGENAVQLHDCSLGSDRWATGIKDHSRARQRLTEWFYGKSADSVTLHVVDLIDAA